MRAGLPRVGRATRWRRRPNGREALDAIRRSPPDLVLLDLAMPVLDGMSVLAEAARDGAAAARRGWS